jgi:hypothetical protein
MMPSVQIRGVRKKMNLSDAEREKRRERGRAVGLLHKGKKKAKPATSADDDLECSNPECPVGCPDSHALRFVPPN